MTPPPTPKRRKTSTRIKHRPAGARYVRVKDLISGRVFTGYATPGPLPGLLFIRPEGEKTKRIYERRKVKLIGLDL